MGRVAQWFKFRVPRLEQRGVGSIPALCASFWSESARRPGAVDPRAADPKREGPLHCLQFPHRTRLERRPKLTAVFNIGKH
jgi:hypothetical protein